MSIALLQMLPSLISAGIATEQQISAIVKSFSPAMTDADITIVLELVKTAAARGLALAQADQKPNA